MRTLLPDELEANRSEVPRTDNIVSPSMFSFECEEKNNHLGAVIGLLCLLRLLLLHVTSERPELMDFLAALNTRVSLVVSASLPKQSQTIWL